MMLVMFGQAFGDVPTYTAKQPDEAYLHRLLESQPFVAIAALAGTDIVGAWQATYCQSLSKHGLSYTSTIWQWIRRIGGAV